MNNNIFKLIFFFPVFIIGCSPKVIQDNKVIGQVTSGTQSPVLNCGIGLARIKSDSILHQQKIKILILLNL